MSRRLRWERFRKMWDRLLIAWVVGIASIVVVVLLFPRFAQGAVVGGVALLIALSMYGLSFDGGAAWRKGYVGEDSTARVLKPLLRQGWRLEHNIPFESFDIDHVLISRHGAIAIETKYTDDMLRVAPEGIERIKWNRRRFPETRAVEQASHAAWKLRSLLRAHPACLTTSVLPVLVLWGPRVDGYRATTLVDGVVVAIGGRSKEWIHTLRGDALSESETELAWEAIVARQRDHVPDRDQRA